MIPLLQLTTIRNTIIQGLYTKLGHPVIPVDDDGDIPDYPYVTYSITSPYIEVVRHDIEEFFMQADALVRVLRKPVECVFSFSAYSPDIDVAQELCLGIVEHFNRTARDDLRDAGIVVVGTSDIQNRSVVLVDHYERRWGVDVRLRVVDRSEIAGDYIETAEITTQGG